MDPSALGGLRTFGGDALLRQLVSLSREQVALRMSTIGAVGMQPLCNALEREAARNEIEPLRALADELTLIAPAVDAWLTGRGFPR